MATAYILPLPLAAFHSMHATKSNPRPTKSQKGLENTGEDSKLANGAPQTSCCGPKIHQLANGLAQMSWFEDNEKDVATESRNVQSFDVHHCIGFVSVIGHVQKSPFISFVSWQAQKLCPQCFCTGIDFSETNNDGVTVRSACLWLLLPEQMRSQLV